MSTRIPQAFIDELTARADIVEVIGTRVQLKKAGKIYKGLCPFHEEKTPSFTVEPTKGFYHCFGCGAHDTAIGFLMNYDNLGFVEAVEELADKLGLEMPTSEVSPGPDQDDKYNLYRILGEADQIYRKALRENQTAIKYLQKRGIDGAAAGRFAIGYAPEGWDTVLKALAQNEEQADALIKAGLVIENETGRRYDRFRDRVMFPIRDQRGRVIGFGGRVLGKGEPKYMNSPETPVFHKGRALYGLHEARQHPGRAREIVVVEGYLDVVSLAQHGIEPAVATLGTATTTDHIRQLTRLSDRVIFCFDGDRAGRAAAWRAAENALPHAGGQVELVFLLIPEGEDPDSLVRLKGAETFKKLLSDALPLSNFLVGELVRQVKLDSVDGRSKLAALAKPVLGKISEGVYRELLVGQLAEKIGITQDRFEALILAEKARPLPARPAPSIKHGRPSLVRQAIGLILHFPGAASQVEPVEGLEKVNQPGIKLLMRILEITRDNPQINTGGLLERFREDPNGRHLGELAKEPALDDAEAAPRVLVDSLGRIVANHRKERLSLLLGRRSELNEDEEAELKTLLRSPEKTADKKAP